MCALCTVYKRNGTKWNSRRKKKLPRIKIEWTLLPAITVSLKLYLAAVFGKSFNLRPLSRSSQLKFASSNTFGIKPAIVVSVSLLSSLCCLLLWTIAAAVAAAAGDDGLDGCCCSFYTSTFFRTFNEKCWTQRNHFSKWKKQMRRRRLHFILSTFMIIVIFLLLFLATLVELDFLQLIHNTFFHETLFTLAVQCFSFVGIALKQTNTHSLSIRQLYRWLSHSIIFFSSLCFRFCFFNRNCRLKLFFAYAIEQDTPEQPIDQPPISNFFFSFDLFFT